MIYKISLAVFFVLGITRLSYCQMQPINIVDSTAKIAGMNGALNLYYGFAAGDQIIFNFSEVNGKELGQIDVSEYPLSGEFAQYKTNQIKNKIINVPTQGVYMFKLVNSELGERVCNVKIQRIPASDATMNFNTAVVWKDMDDSAYTIEQEKYLVKTDTVISNFFQQTAKVNSRSNVTLQNYCKVSFTIPENTIAWSYYISADQAGEAAYDDAVTKLFDTGTKAIAPVPGYGPMAVLALGGNSYLTTATSGQKVGFYIANNKNIKINEEDGVVNSFSRVTNPLSGDCYFYLVNQNPADISVSLRATAIIVNRKWGTQPVKKYTVTTKKTPFSVK